MLSLGLQSRRRWHGEAQNLVLQERRKVRGPRGRLGKTPNWPRGKDGKGSTVHFLKRKPLQRPASAHSSIHRQIDRNRNQTLDFHAVEPLPELPRPATGPRCEFRGRK